VRARGAHNVHIAQQSVDNEFWRAPVRTPDFARWPAAASTRFLFVGRRTREKGVPELLQAWSQAELASHAGLLLVGPHEERSPDSRFTAEQRLAAGIAIAERVGSEDLRSIYAAADALVLPSIATRTFREPWGLVVNEAMNQGLPVIATDAVGAAAGGLVRDGHTGLVVPAGDTAALARALRRLADDRELRMRLGAAGAEAVEAFSHDAWAEGFSRALLSVGAARERW
jgi:glycosyltransferase involved in cell wall biosynthesis